MGSGDHECAEEGGGKQRGLEKVCPARVGPYVVKNIRTLWRDNGLRYLYHPAVLVNIFACKNLGNSIVYFNHIRRYHDRKCFAGMRSVGWMAYGPFIRQLDDLPIFATTFCERKESRPLHLHRTMI